MRNGSYESEENDFSWDVEFGEDGVDPLAGVVSNEENPEKVADHECGEPEVSGFFCRVFPVQYQHFDENEHSDVGVNGVVKNPRVEGVENSWVDLLREIRYQAVFMFRVYVHAAG